MHNWLGTGAFLATATSAVIAQAPNLVPLPAEYQQILQLNSDKERTELAWKAAKDPRLSDLDKFRLVLQLTLEMRDRGPFNWEQMSSEPNWDSTMTLFVRSSGMASANYPFLKPWAHRHHDDQLLERLVSMGYYKKDGTTPARKRFSAKDKKMILDYALGLYQNDDPLKP